MVSFSAHNANEAIIFPFRITEGEKDALIADIVTCLAQDERSSTVETAYDLLCGSAADLAAEDIDMEEHLSDFADQCISLLRSGKTSTVSDDSE